MANNELGKIRRSQNLNAYGPGAIIDFRAGARDGAPVSAVAAGLEMWNEHAPPADLRHPQTTFEPRLQEMLGIEGFRLPPVAPDVAPGVPGRNAGHLIAVRYPAWLQCPSCQLLQPAGRWGAEGGDPSLYCDECTSRQDGQRRVHAIPVRFIAACENGHLEDFPWNWWVQHREPGCRGRLYLKNEGGAGLAGLILSCEKCKANRPMQGCFAPDALRGLGACKGRRPWLTTDDPSCTGQLRAFQRGASCLYFPVVASALDIPPFADRIQQQLGVYWQKIRGKKTAAERRNLIEVAELDKDLGMDLGKLHAEVEARIAALGVGGLRTIRWEEYRQFIAEPPVRLGERAEFEIRPLPVPAELTGLVRRLVQATRLREVRALRAFTRVRPPDPSDATGGRSWAPIHDPDKRPNWLPGVEVRGEGIFVELDPDAVSRWEDSNPSICATVERIDSAYAADWKQRNKDAARPRKITPRFLLVHSLAHALIRQLGVECGYSTASLRERLYVDSGEQAMTALLIYTATPDSDGTLGGLASQAEPGRFVRTLEAAIKSASWCSSDPLCIANVNAFTEPTNGAACHACMLVPETSCEEFNRFLDRSTLVGTPDAPKSGFFEELV